MSLDKAEKPPSSPLVRFVRLHRRRSRLVCARQFISRPRFFKGKRGGFLLSVIEHWRGATLRWLYFCLFGLAVHA